MRPGADGDARAPRANISSCATEKTTQRARYAPCRLCRDGFFVAAIGPRFFCFGFRASRAGQPAGESTGALSITRRPANFVEGLRLGAGRARVGRARRRVGAYRTSVRYPEPPGKTPAHPTRAQTRFPARHALCDLFVPIYRIRHHGCEARGPGPRGQERREGHRVHPRW